MSTKGHESEAIRVEGVQHSFQKFKDDLIGIPNITEAVYYTQQEVDAYNAELTGALDSTTPLTAEQAAAYNAAVTGATKEAGDTLSAEEAAAYNATLDGAVTTEDVKTPAVPKKVKAYVDEKDSQKADKVSGSGLNNHLAALNSNGNLKDSGIPVDDVMQKDGYSKDLHAGLADNLYGETQTNDVFTFRPTAGIQDVASGDAPVGGGTIKKVEGNAVAWNQLVSAETRTSPDLTLTKQADGTYKVSGTTSSVGFFSMTDTIPSGHKAYYKYTLVSGGGIVIYDGVNTSATGYISTSSSGIYTLANASCLTLLVNIDYTENSVFSLTYIDLTLLGIDNLTTVADVEQWLANNVGLKGYYPYNAGELIPVKDFKVKSVGFNQIPTDTVWTNAKVVDNNTGMLIDWGIGWNASDYIRILPNKNYYINLQLANELGYAFYDENYNFVGGNYTNSFTTPSNAFYIRISSDRLQSTILNLSYDGDRDGEYEEYWEREVGIDVTKLKGKLNGTGSSIVVFPDGLKKAGTVCDEIVQRGNQVIGIKRLVKKTFNLYDTWYYNQTYNCFYCPLAVAKVGFKAISERYPYVGAYSKLADKTCAYIFNSHFAVRDSSYSDADTFKSSFNGVSIYYELETPQEYLLDDEVLPMQYRVDDYGTEEVELGNDEGLVSCSPKITIKYGLNAANTIADLPHEYVSVLRQQLSDDDKVQARENIDAASRYDIIRLQDEIDVINKKGETDYWVDLGLPSGTLWAKRNIDVTRPDGFATSPYQYECSFFSWGNTDGHNPSSESSFAPYSWGMDNTEEPYVSSPGASLTASFGLSFDAAFANLGNQWRMPTTEEFAELFNNIDYINPDGTAIATTQANKLVTVNGVLGLYLKSKNNGKRIFFPCSGGGRGTSYINRGAVGRYFSSSLTNATDAQNMAFKADGVYPQNHIKRHNGLAVRPVQNNPSNS